MHGTTCEALKFMQEGNMSLLHTIRASENHLGWKRALRSSRSNTNLALHSLPPSAHFKATKD